MKLIKIGKIVNTHGIKGEIRILSKFPYKDKLFIKDMPLYIDKVNKEIINTYRKHKNFDMVTFLNYNNINEVLKYKGKNVYADADLIVLDKEKYLDEDIIGLDVFYNNIFKGKVSLVERYDTNTLLVIKNDNLEYLIPYNKDIIEKIDILNKKIIVKDIKGLF